MNTPDPDRRTVPTEQTREPNISTENQPKGSGRRPSDTLDGPEADSGSGGGNLARDIGSRDEERTATGGDPEPTRVTKQDKVQPDTGTQADNEGAQTSKD
ncbi:hypothetical protein MRBLMC3_001840 [Sphingobium sp. LMC3-1-1.1]|uniref:hypothetical protein n=1 Tax=Sphingobium sp. LMC3-1-1.1 TaxID=3135241 RepID=UPI003416109F